MPNKSSHKSHLFSRIFKNFLGIVRGTTKAVWRPNHGQVIYVHLCYNAHMREWENLQTTKEAESFPKKMFSTMQVLTVLRIRTPSPENLQTTKEAESFPKKMFSTMQVLTVLRIRTPSLRTSKFELKKNPTSENKETPCMQQRFSRGLDRLSPLITEHPINYLISQIRGEYNSFPTFCSVNDLR